MSGIEKCSGVRSTHPRLRDVYGGHGVEGARDDRLPRHRLCGVGSFIQMIGESKQVVFL